MEMFLISFADLLLHSQIKHSTKKVQEKPAIGRFFSLSWLQFLSFENLTAVDISNDFAAWQNVTPPVLKWAISKLNLLNVEWLSDGSETGDWKSY